MKKYVIGVDNGGTFIKAAIYDQDGKQICLNKVPSSVITPQPDICEINMDEMWEENCRCIRGVIEESGISAENIVGIGFAGQGKGVYPLDKEKKPFRNAITSSDGRSVPYFLKWWNDGTTEHLFDKTYQGIFSSHPATILAWMKENEPENYQKIGWLLGMKDYLVYKMTGQIVSDYSNQSGNCYLNFNTLQYDPDIYDTLELPEIADKLPKILWSSEVCGTVTPEAAEAVGLKEGTKVIAGLFDINASLLAMGATSDELIYMILGTNGINAYVRNSPIIDKSVWLNSLYCVPGLYLIEEGGSTSSGNLEWVIDVLYGREREECRKSGKDIYKLLNGIVEATAPTDSEIIFLPFLHGSSDSPFSKGTWVGMTPNDTRADLLRSCYEGVAFAHRAQYEKMQKSRKKPAAVRIAGGANQSAVWMQMFADVLDTSVEIIEGAELGTRGVAMATGVGTGIYKDYVEAVEKNVVVQKIYYPRKEMKAIYDEKYMRYNSVIENIHGYWENLANKS